MVLTAWLKGVFGRSESGSPDLSPMRWAGMGGTGAKSPLIWCYKMLR